MNQFKQLFDQWMKGMGEIGKMKESLLEEQKVIIIGYLSKQINEVFLNLQMRVKDAILKSKKKSKKNERSQFSFSNLEC